MEGGHGAFQRDAAAQCLNGDASPGGELTLLNKEGNAILQVAVSRGLVGQQKLSHDRGSLVTKSAGKIETEWVMNDNSEPWRTSKGIGSQEFSERY